MKPLPIIANLWAFCSLLFTANQLSAQTIGTFGSVTPGGQTSTLTIPATHVFQRIIKTGDALSLGGTLGVNLDFTGYVPISGSSRNGYLSISTEDVTAEIAMLSINYNYTTHTWQVTQGGKVSFPAAALGTVTRFCSGTVTPNGTIMVGEESTSSGDVNADTYQDVGWIIEVDPATRTVINQDGAGGVDKLWAAGRQSHENAVVKSDNSAIYWGADANPTGYLYKFVPTTPGVWSSGLLYVLDAPGLAGNGTWRLIPNTTIAQRNATVANSTSAGADNFNGIEDVEIAPDGKIYFAAKGEGKIYRFTDNGTYGTGTDISGLMVFAGNSSYPTITSYDVDGGGPLGSQSWGTGNDNLAFDGEGNLWVLNDGGGGHIWVIAPTHTQASPQVRLFARTPSGSEPTGITFTPDYKFMFLSFQHPAAAGSQTDAAGVSVTFSTHTTVVIARAENLGPFATLPLDFTGFNVKHAGEAVQINWTAANITNHDYFSIERSVDGVRWEEFSRLDDDIDGVDHQSFQVMDNNPPASSIVYYRIKQCDRTGECNYSEIRSLKWSGNDQIVRMYPQPATDQLNISYRSYTEGMVTITIRDMNGKTVQKDTRAIQDGSQTIAVNTSPLRSGVYLVTITDKNFQSSTQKFIKE